MEQDNFLQAQQSRLTEMLRPYQRELTRRQRLADFVNACIRSVGRDDFFTLYELLQSRACSEVEAEPGCEEARDIFHSLRADATRKVERSQLSFQEDFTRLAQEAGLSIAAKKSPKVPLQKSPGVGNFRAHPHIWGIRLA